METQGTPFSPQVALRISSFYIDLPASPWLMASGCNVTLHFDVLRFKGVFDGAAVLGQDAATMAAAWLAGEDSPSALGCLHVLHMLRLKALHIHD